MTVPKRLLIKPQIRPFGITLNYRNIDKPLFRKTPLPEFHFTSHGHRIGRKPLQLAAVGAFIAGSTIGALVAGAMPEELRVQINDLKYTSDIQIQAIRALSSSLHATTVFLHTIYSEQSITEEQMKTRWETRKQIDQALRWSLIEVRSQTTCLQINSLLNQAFDEIRNLFTSAVGHETAHDLTLLNPFADSYCIHDL